MMVVRRMVFVAVAAMLGRMGVRNGMGVVRGHFVAVRDSLVVVIVVVRRIRMAMVVVTMLVMSRPGRSMSLVMALMPGVRRRGSGLGMGLMTMAGVVAMLFVRLVLVAHLDPVPQPLSAVLQRQSGIT